ncbi:MAG: hypothetical protein IPO36_10480 [Anaerolineales bacterium]|nr:hypothetical protein [Anaerolineales bacterium]
MRRLSLVMILTIFMQACSLATPTAEPPTITPTPTITSTPTITPTITITPTRTALPTIVRIPTWDPNGPTATFQLIPIYIGSVTATPILSPTPTRPGLGFVSVDVSEEKIFWGSCKHNKAKIIAKVQNPDDVYSVVIFVRVKALLKEDYTPWTQGDVMEKHGDGTFSYTLVGSEIEGHNHYRDSWVYFQLVATDELGEIIGRTMIYTNSLSLSPCK